MTKYRKLFLGLAIYLTIIVGLATLNGVLVALSIPLLITLGYGLLTSPQSLSVEIVRRLNRTRVHPYDPVSVELRVKNLGPKIPMLLLEDLLPEGLSVIEGENSMICEVEEGEEISISYSVSGSRGYYRFEQTAVHGADLLNIDPKTERIEVVSKLFIQPRTVQVGRIPIRPRSTRVYSGFIPARRGGPGVEFYGVREYQTGDPLRWINWRTTARSANQYYINQFEQERVADIGIILDTRIKSDVRTLSGKSIFEYCVQAAAAVSDSLLSDGNRVGLLMYGTQLDWTAPGYGKDQKERILQALSRVTLGDSLVFGSLDRLPTRFFAPHSQIILVSPLNPDDDEMIIRLRGRGYSILIVSPDPIPFELKELDSEDDDILLAARIARLERRLLLNKLQQADIDVLDWDVDDLLDNIIHMASQRSIPVVSSNIFQG